MKQLFIIDDTLTNKISYFHLMALVVSLPFDFFFTHVILISFAFHTLINTPKNRFQTAFNLKTLLLQTVFFVTIISTAYSSYKSLAMQEWLRQISIFLFPVLFYFTGLNIAKYRSRLMSVFAICCTLTVIFLYLDAVRIIRYFKLPATALFSKYFTNHNFSAPIAMHATFFSLQLGLALVFLVSILINETKWFNRVVYTIGCLVLSAGIIQLCSKAVGVALLLSINIAIPYFMICRTNRLKFILLSVSISIVLIFVVFTSTTFRERYVTDLKVDLSKSNNLEVVDPRLARWGAAGELIKKSPVIGYGAGSELAILHEQFFNKKLYTSYLKNLNAHNQYISMLLAAGIWGLLAYLITLAFGFKVAIAKQDALFFTFMVLIAIVSLSESFLNAEKGIYFYSFFFSFFIFSVKPEGAKSNYLFT